MHGVMQFRMLQSAFAPMQDEQELPSPPPARHLPMHEDLAWEAKQPAPQSLSEASSA